MKNIKILRNKYIKINIKNKKYNIKNIYQYNLLKTNIYFVNKKLKNTIYIISYKYLYNSDAYIINFLYKNISIKSLIDNIYFNIIYKKYNINKNIIKVY